jgi:hypothetical protein
VRSCATHDWIAAWSQNSSGTYDLYVVNGTNGTKKKVTSERSPGGFCWIPNTMRLLYCRGIYNDKVDFSHVTYYSYNVDTEQSKKLIEVNDMLDTYFLDPIASESGDMAFHMTIAGTRQGDVPSFNLYNAERDFMMPLPVQVNIASDYDLSADGTKLFWIMHDPDTTNLFIVGFDINKQRYSDIYEYGASADPADDHALLKVQSTSNRAATLATSEADATLKLCTYDFSNENSLYIQPLYLLASEEIICFDWKGFSEWIYALINNTTSGEYTIEEINVISGERKRLLTTTDEISFVDYSTQSKTYYYSVVDQRNGGDAVTSLIRLK